MKKGKDLKDKEYRKKRFKRETIQQTRQTKKT